ncbi:uncharacterized protein [Drosophila virilis]|uniref:uncharacterized protein n=1 Tax=Drosophila virilis TaxID=7244 RepID=UPI0038B2F2A5
MTQVSPSSNPNNFYLPHHAVFKPDSTTTNVRVVFNASSVSNGKSLNNIPHTGPVLQSDLTIQILKWRFYRYVFNADITKMYQQIQVDIRPPNEYYFAMRTRTDDVDDVLIAKLFDPAGWLAPVIVRAKIFMQEIWLQELGWDDSLPEDLVQRWHDFLTDYPSLEEIRIASWVDFQQKAKVQFHGFCDASQRAYGTALYLRVEINGCISTHLATKIVAPVKTVSLPRLELCGAVLLSKLTTAVIPQLPFQTNRVAKISSTNGNGPMFDPNITRLT